MRCEMWSAVGATERARFLLTDVVACCTVKEPSEGVSESGMLGNSDTVLCYSEDLLIQQVQHSRLTDTLCKADIPPLTESAFTEASHCPNRGLGRTPVSCLQCSRYSSDDRAFTDIALFVQASEHSIYICVYLGP